VTKSLAAVEIKALTKVFGQGDSAVKAFGPSDLNVTDGEFVSLLGPSGCGKSTLLLMVAGLLDSSSGSIHVKGKRVNGPRTDIGIMFQDNTLVPWRTVRGNIELQLELRGLNPKDYQERISNLLTQVSLQDFADNSPYELSGGMQQRAAFCQALVHEPDTLLLDEPLGKLDAMTREAIRRDLQSLWMQKKQTVLLVTHSIEEAVQLSNRVIVISPRPGRIEKIYDIDLPWPRDLAVKNSPAFADYVMQIQLIFHGYGVL
jgi:NitT/TauT family transport system ATP-binding protein